MVSSSTRVIQVTNIAPQATKDQMQTLFGYLGKIDDIRLYPTIRDVSCPVQSRICYVKYYDTAPVGVAQHMTNTVFIDRALIVIPLQSGEIPDEHKALEMSSNGTLVPGLNASEPRLPAHIVNSLEGVPPNQVIQTHDPRLTAAGLPAYPPLPAAYDSRKIEEIRRTILCLDVHSAITSQQLIDHFCQAGEVKFLRFCDRDSDKLKYALVEFSEQDSVLKALRLNGSTIDGHIIKVHHATQAISKPQTKSNEAAQREIEEAMCRVKEAQNLISAAIDPVIGMLSKDKRRTRSRSRSRRRSRSKSRSRRRSRSRHRSRRSRSRHRSRRSRSKHRHRTRSRSRKRSHSRKKSRSRERKRSRSRDKKRSRSRDKKRSRSRDKKRSRSQEKKRSRSREKKRSRSKDKKRSRSKDRKRSRSRSRRSKSRSKREIKTPLEAKTKEKSPNPPPVVKEKETSVVQDKEKAKSPGRSRSRKKSRSRDRKRSRSRDRKRSRSRDRKRSRSRDRKRSRSRDRKRSRSRDRKRSRSRSRRSKSKSKRENKTSLERKSKEKSPSLSTVVEEKQPSVSTEPEKSKSPTPPPVEGIDEKNSPDNMDISNSP